AQRLAPHLPARRAELGHALHRVEPLVEEDQRRDLARSGAARRVGDRDGVARAGTPLEVGPDEGLEARALAHAPLLRVRLEAEGMREPARGEEPGGELEEGEARRARLERLAPRPQV